MIKIKPVKILIVKLKFHGDMLLTTPVLHAVKDSLPDATVDYLLYRDTLPILSEQTLVNQFYCITRKPKSVLAQMKELFCLLITLRKNKYDIIINLTEQWPIAFVIKQLKAKSIAFTKVSKYSSWWARCFSILAVEQGTHTVEKNLSILKPLDIDTKNPKLSMHYDSLNWLALQEKVPLLRCRCHYVVVQPTARQLFKCWDDDKFARVIDHLNELGLDVFLTSGPADADLKIIDNIYTLCKRKPIIELAGKTSLLELAALIDHACLFVGVDSAPMHMAAALDTPIICLFGATNFKQWGPWSSRYTLLWAGHYQAMPERKNLNRQFKYLSCIPVNDVIQAIDSMLAVDRNLTEISR